MKLKPQSDKKLDELKCKQSISGKHEWCDVPLFQGMRIGDNGWLKEYYKSVKQCLYCKMIDDRKPEFFYM